MFIYLTEMNNFTENCLTQKWLINETNIKSKIYKEQIIMKYFITHLASTCNFDFTLTILIKLNVIESRGREFVTFLWGVTPLPPSSSFTLS